MMMRVSLALLALGCAACASADGVGAASQPPAAGAPLVHTVSQDHGPQRVEVVVRDVPPGGVVPWHRHAGVEIAHVVSGEMDTLVAGQPPRRYPAGSFFKAERGVVHSARNSGSEPAHLVITYVLDRDAPQREPAETPEGY